jgi:Gram-negative bacterial TonB protein C-terminal
MKSATVLIVALLTAPYLTVNAQTVSGDAPGQVVLTDLSTPTYPPVAREARIAGDETVLVKVRPDGTVESTVVESGPALLVLRQAVMDSASKSNYQCRNCKETMAYRIVYAFKIVQRADCCNALTVAPRVEHHPEGPAQSRVNIEAEEVCTCDPAAKRIRSLKCLYLWKCGSS